MASCFVSADEAGVDTAIAFTLSPIYRTFSQNFLKVAGGGGWLVSPNRTGRDCLVCEDDLKRHLYVGETGSQHPPPRFPLGVRVDVKPLGGTVDLEFLQKLKWIHTNPPQTLPRARKDAFAQLALLNCCLSARLSAKKEFFFPTHFVLFRV